MENTTLQAGYAKINITPDFSVGIGGYSNAETRRSNYVEAPIFATCIALTDGAETVLLYTIDNCGLGRNTIDKIASIIEYIDAFLDVERGMDSSGYYSVPLTPIVIEKAEVI